MISPSTFALKNNLGKIGVSPTADPDIIDVTIVSYNEHDGTTQEETIQQSVSELQAVYASTIQYAESLASMATAMGITLAGK